MQALNLTSNYPKLAFISRFLQKKTILIKPGLFFKKINAPKLRPGLMSKFFREIRSRLINAYRVSEHFKNC